jgi:hypothetical protein
MWCGFAAMKVEVDKKMFGSNRQLYIFASPLTKRVVLRRKFEERIKKKVGG